MNLLTVNKTIDELEDKKMELLMQGAEFDQVKMAEIYAIDERLKKLYKWYR